MKTGLKRLFKVWCYLMYRRNRELSLFEIKHGCTVCGFPGHTRHAHHKMEGSYDC